MNNEFFKPFFGEIYNTQSEKRFFVYDRDELKKEKIFPYLVLDGGAFFLMDEKFGGTDSDTLLEKTMSGEVFDFIREKDATINWGLSYDLSERYGISKKHEWQSWPQRLYMLLPLAQEYMKTGDKKYSDKWLTIFKKWVDESPYEKTDLNTPSVLANMKWRDMQVGWRTLTVIYSIFMLGENAPFTKEQWKFIYDFLEISFEHLVYECEFDVNANRFGNHVLQKALGILTGGVLFPEMKNSEKYIEVGRNTMLFCHKNAILNDGGSNEASPSYSHFIARLYVEGEMNLERNNYPQMEGIHDSILRQYNWLTQMSTKEGRTIRTSDSYGMYAHADIRRVAKIMGFTPDFTKKTVYMENSQMGIIRNAKCELFFDGMKHYGGHQHDSHLNLIWYADGKPILTDTGCCNYDWTESYHRCGNKRSHNVVFGEEFVPTETSISVEDVSFDESTNTFFGTVITKDKEHELVWKRTATLDGTTLTVKDEMKANKPINLRGNFILADKGITLDDEIWKGMGGIVKSNGENSVFKLLHGLDLVKIKSSAELLLDRIPVMNEENQPDRAILLSWGEFAKEKTVITVISLEEK